MQLGKIVGTIVATQKEKKLEGLKFHIVKATDYEGNTNGSFLVAVDAMGAGIGEIVLTASGSAARLTPITKDRPVDAVIMAIVDIVEINGEERYKKNWTDRRDWKEGWYKKRTAILFQIKTNKKKENKTWSFEWK